MCGRYTIKAPVEAIEAELSLSEHLSGDFEPRYNVAPMQPAFVVTGDAPHRLQTMRWGLVPSWSKDPKMAYSTINARSETVGTLASFRSAYRERRCLVPMSGYYEWHRLTDKVKQPYYIHADDGKLIVCAGLWETWLDAEQRPIHTFTIVTSPPNQFMERLHDRMPVILEGDARAAWIDPRTPLPDLQSLMVPAREGLLSAYPVGDDVGNVRNEGPHLIQPVPAKEVPMESPKEMVDGPPKSRKKPSKASTDTNQLSMF